MRLAVITVVAVLTLGCGDGVVSPVPSATLSRTAPQPLAQPCSIASQVVTVVLSPNETATLTLDGAGALLVNTVACSTATNSNTRRILVSSQDLAGATDETVIIDGSNGFFALGLVSGGGIVVNLGAGTDLVQVIGTAGDDVMIAGRSTTEDWLIVNQDLYRDVTFNGVEQLTLTGAGGADVLTGAGLDAVWLRATHYTTGLPTLRALTIEGGAGTDTLTGGGANDTLRGGTEADTLTGGPGDDTLFGDAGDDVFEEGTGPSGADVVNGGAGSDTVRYASRTIGLTVTVGSGANDGEPSEGDELRDDIEVVLGGSANDSLTCSIGTGCTLRGGGGDDVLTGNAGADTLDGEAGDDTVRPGTGTDTATGGAGTDTITYSERAVMVTVVLGSPGTPTTSNGIAAENDSLDGFENVVGGAGDDSLTGNALPNRLTGGAGNDTLVGGDGDDVFDEGSATNGADSITGGNGVDRVDYSARSIGVSVSLDTTANDGQASESDNVDVENITGGAGNDTLTGSPVANVIDGNAGNDTLQGLDGNDALSGGEGNDSLSGGNGDDILEDLADGGTCDCGAGLDIAICDSAPASCEVR